MKKFFYISLLLILPVWVHAKTYYVSSNGNDNNKGTTPENAFATIDRLNDISFKPGDKILFRKGDVFTGELIVQASGTESKPIVFSSYGKDGDPLPVLTGAIDLDGLALHQGNLYKVKLDRKVSQLYINNNYQNVGRLPDEGYFFIDEGDSIQLKDDELSDKPNLVGSTVRIQTVNWQWEIREVVKHQKNHIKFDSLLWHTAKPDFGYYLENKLQFVNQPGEWYYDETAGELYLYLTEKLKNQQITATVFETGMHLKKGASNIVVEGLKFEKYNNAGIALDEFVSNVSIINNHFRNMEVFGIVLDTACNACSVSNNLIEDVLGRGISLLEPQNCKIAGNKIKRTGMIAGHGFDGVNSGVAICIENVEFRDPGYTRIAKNNLVSGNRIDSTGYGGIRADGAYNIIEYNVVKEAVLTMNDGGGIYCWGKNYEYTFENVFRKNIVMNVHGNMETAAGDHKIITCLYMDNYSHNCIIEDNIFIGAQTGLILNDLSHSHIVRNNKFYDVETGISYSVWFTRGENPIRGKYHVTNNIFYSRGNKNRSIVIANHLNVEYDIGVLDSNLYVSPFYMNIVKKTTNYDGYKLTYDYEFDAWQSMSGKDEHSVAILPKPGEKYWRMEEESVVLVNDQKTPKEIDLGDMKYYDVNGKEISGKITVQPFDARILYNK
jgi:hypothetical protein